MLFAKKGKLLYRIKRRFSSLPYVLQTPMLVYAKWRYKGSERGDISTSLIMEQFTNVLTEDLYRKFEDKISSLSEKIDKEHDKLPHEHPKIIWVCWLQGMENAPELVKACYRSLTKNFKHEYEIITLSLKNYGEYVEFPDYITKLYEAGKMPHAHFADLLRIALLNKYGGTWVDSTIYFSGGLGGGIQIYA